MKVLRPEGDPDAFFATLAGAPARVLMLDYDGTLAPFREERNEAVPYPGVRRAVEDVVTAGHTRVVVVSGRAVDVLRELLAVDPEPEMWGSHGWERYRPGGGVETGDPGPTARAALDRALEVVRREAPTDAVETKPVSVAVHTRGRDEADVRSFLPPLRREWGALADDAGLEVHDFDGGVEIRVPGRDKGTAVEAVLADARAGAATAYLGDDRTDEDAFRALDGRGLPVLCRDRLRATSAALWIRPPGELLEFLERWNSAAGVE